MVGEAFTLRYIPAREDLNPITVFRDRAHPQRKAVEECPPGAVMVIELESCAPPVILQPPFCSRLSSAEPLSNS